MNRSGTRPGSNTGLLCITGIPALAGCVWNKLAKALLVILLGAVCGSAYAQIDRIEYYIDVDPGAGQGVNVLFAPGGDLNNLSVSIAVDTLQPGIHQVWFRARDTAGTWSLSQRRHFYKPPPTVIPANVALTTAEWFLDNDPGVGNANSINLSSADPTNIVVSVDPAGLAPGLHHFCVRARDDAGNWSLVQRVLFYRPDATLAATAPSGIAYIEYYLDDDPGRGNATEIALPATAAGLADITIPINASALTAGLHQLHIRARDSSGNWCLSQRALFFKPGATVSPNPLPDLTRIEWFLDNDPGVGNASAIDLATTTDPANIVVPINPALLSVGLHQFYVRAKDNAGNWSLAQRALFFRPDTTAGTVAMPYMAYAEYYFDNDPGRGAGTPITIPQSQNAADIMVAADVSVLGLGSHKFFLRVKDTLGKWSLVNKADFTLYSPTLTVGTVAFLHCVSDSFDVPYTINGTFGISNIFTVQLSDSNGNFANAVNIGALNTNVAGAITALVPPNVPDGIGYRLRVLSSSPADTSAPNTLALAVRHVPAEVFQIAGDTSLCANSASNYYGYNITGPLSYRSYTWQLSGGGALDTSGYYDYVDWEDQGIHQLINTASNECGIGYSDTLNVHVFQGTLSIVPTITQSGDWLYASIESEANGVAGYQWYKNNVLLNGADSSAYHTLSDGIYQARYVNPCGMGGFSQGFTVTSANIINFAAIPDKTFGDNPFALGATASSGLPVSFTVISGTGAVTVSGSTVTITGAGYVGIQATQSGNSTIPAAVPVTQYFYITQALQTITFSPVPDKNYGDAPFTVTASASSGLPVSFAVLSGLPYASVSGNTVTITGGGHVVLQAYHPGDQNYLEASATDTFCIGPSQPGTIFGNSPTCIGTQYYSVNSVPGFQYTWTVSSNGTPNPATGVGTNVTWSATGPATVTVAATTSCPGLSETASRTVDVVAPPTLAAPASLQPADSVVLSTYPAYFSWSAPADAQLYDLYIWPEDSAAPTVPLMADLTQINVPVYGYQLPGYEPGQRYYWRVVARNLCVQSSSDTQTFTIAGIPDLVVSNVEATGSIYAGQNIGLYATVQNIGQVQASGTWQDAFYLSADTVLSPGIDIALGTIQNSSALNPSESYTGNLNATLPPLVVGQHYIIAVANNGGDLIEATAANNTFSKPIFINQNPLPDLKITSVVSTTVTYSGVSLPVTWTGKNQGPSSTGAVVWRDDIYISPDSVFSTATATKIGELFYTGGGLDPDSTYTGSASVLIPDQTFGTQYIHVQADATNAVYESAFENNNIAHSEPISVYQTPPADFAVEELNVPLYASRGETVTFEWTIENVGYNRPLSDSIWHDLVCVTADPLFNPSSDLVHLAVSPPLVLSAACATNPLGTGGCRYVTPQMLSGQQYYQSTTVTLPPGSSGDTLYVMLHTDAADSVYEAGSEQNNTAIRKIVLRNPDLHITNTQTPVMATAGTSIYVNWTVKNLGPGKVPQLDRSDNIYLSATPVLNPGTAILLGSLSYNNTMDSGASLLRQKNVQLPSNVAGAQYIFVVANGQQVVPEVSYANNTSTASPITINFPPLADMRVSQVIMSNDSAMAGQKLGIKYKIKNHGDGTLAGVSWTDKVYVSASASWNVGAMVEIKTIAAAYTLLPDSSYEVVDSVLISAGTLQVLQISADTGYFYVYTDADNQIFENAYEGNNTGVSTGVFLKQHAQPDLKLLSVTADDTLHTGASASVSWGGINTGGTTANFTSQWSDGIYLSLDTVWDSGDLPMAHQDVSGPLDSNAQYTRTATFAVPNGLSGYYYVLVAADEYNQTGDANPANNSRAAMGQTGQAQASYAALTPWGDLVVDSLWVPPTGNSGQPVWVKWVGRNAGSGTTNAAGWTDRVYLSADATLNAGDMALGYTPHTGAPLAAGATYTDSVFVYLPSSAVGNYYLLLSADDANSVYEYTGEGNNTKAALHFVTQQPPCDLTVLNVAADTLAFAGDSAHIAWTLMNEGANPVSGYMRQGVYLSADNTWSNDDILIGSPESYNTLAPGASAQCTTAARVVDVTPGYYHAIIRTDLLNNINEQNEANNTTAGVGSVLVKAHDLPLNIVQHDTLRNDYEVYYQIAVVDTLLGETLSVLLKGDSLNAANELYLRRNAMPTRAVFDYQFGQPANGNQQVIVPVLDSGVYYLLVYGVSPVAPEQPITLLAQKIPFSILDVEAHEGGNKGTVTIKISGAKYQPGMKARLHSTALGTITASSVYCVSPTVAYATFNLAGKQTGLYSLKLIKPGVDSVSAPDVFTIVPGVGGIAGDGSSTGSTAGFYCQVTNIGVEGQLGVDVQRPGSTLINRTFPMTIIFGNSGSQDIPVPARMLVSTAGYPISRNLPGLADQKTEIFLEFKEASGPPTVLRPGAVGYITIFTTSSGTAVMNFKLVE